MARSVLQRFSDRSQASATPSTDPAGLSRIIQRALTQINDPRVARGTLDGESPLRLSADLSQGKRGSRSSIISSGFMFAQIQAI